MIRAILIVCVLALTTESHKMRFDNYKVYRMDCPNEKKVPLIKKIEQFNDFNLSNQTTDDIIYNDHSDLIVSPKKAPVIEYLMDKQNISYEIIDHNIQKLIDEESSNKTKGFLKSYHTLSEIYMFLDMMKQQYPNEVELIVLGKSSENREIRGVKLFGGANKSRTFLEGGIHAREWIAPATMLFLIHELLTSQNPEVLALREYEFHIVPTVNPDGYVYTHTTNRMWRKTRSLLGFCYGADANRNFDFQWSVKGASRDPCDETFSGRRPFSEPESRSMAKYLIGIRDRLFAYLSFHSYSQLLMFPYGDGEHRINNPHATMAIGIKTARSLAKRYGTKYTVGNIVDILYPASGSSIDWVKAKLKVPLTYVYELRDNGNHGFILPASQIVPTGEEVLDSLITMFSEAKKFGYTSFQ